MLSKEWLPKPLRGLASKLIWEIEKFTSRYLDAVVTPTEIITERFRQLKARRVFTLYNFPSVELLTAENFNPLDTIQFDLIHVGTLSPPRLSFMFSVAHELRKMGREAKWCILGASPQVIKWAKDRLMKLDLADNFTIEGWVPYIEVRKYLCQSRIGINHHLAEPRFLVAIPAKVFEYMAAGKAIIASRIGQITEVLHDDKSAVLYDPGNISELQEKLVDLLRDESRRIKLGENARQIFLQGYTWAHKAKELEQFLQTYTL